MLRLKCGAAPAGTPAGGASRAQAPHLWQLHI